MIALIKYLFRNRGKGLKRVPRELVEDAYDLTDGTITQQHIILIRSGHARTPIHAEKLFEKYGSRRAIEVIEQIPDTGTPFLEKVKRRLVRLIAKLEGAGRDPMNVKWSDKRDELPMYWRWRDER